MRAYALLAGASLAAAEFSWDSVPASKTLDLHACFDEFQCAKLILPLDWTNKSDTRTVTIAMVKLPAVVDPDDATYGGPVFTNPGGPGGSGVNLVLGRGKYLQWYVDKPGVRHYDIVSFDPRGIGESRPRADCYPGDLLTRDARDFEYRGTGTENATHAASVAYKIALMDGYARHCADAEALGLNGGDIFRYMGTPSVTHDMVAMLDGLHAKRNQQEEQLELRKRNADVPRMQYIGFSYGTVLGNYFAALHPGRIGRLVLDGVCNTDDYANGPGWLTNTVDTDAMFDAFFTGCHSAGQKMCALARPSDKSASDLRTRVWGWINSLDADPIVAQAADGATLVITSRDVLQLIGQALYSPIAAFRGISIVLDDAMNGSTAYLAFILSVSLIPALENACSPDASPAVPALSRDTLAGVLCGDGDDVTGRNLSYWRSYIAQQTAQSSVFGSYWSQIRMACASWAPLHARYTFRGPFTTPDAAKVGEKPGPGQPAAPVLFLSNTLDPVTPLSAARKMAAAHPGAQVLTQHAMGHCAVFSGLSECTRRQVAEYFDTGRMPANETCEIECGPWDDGCAGVTVQDSKYVNDTQWYARRLPLGI